MKQRAPPSRRKDTVNIKMTLNLFLQVNWDILQYGRDLRTGFIMKKTCQLDEKI